MGEEFKREERYIVTKIKSGKRVECVVVESDWPEYEIVWNMLADRIQGRPNRIQELSTELAASQAREAELRERLETLEANAQIEIDRLNAQILDRDTKMEAAERRANEWRTISDEFLKRIKVSQEREPVAIAECVEVHGMLCQFLNRTRHGMATLCDGDKLYTAPVIPPELAELPSS